MKGDLHVIILAAGEGKRMRSSTPKVLQPIAGRAMLEHVIATARALEARKIHVVHGHQSALVRAHIGEHDDLIWVEQAQQLGTGHAVLQAMPNIPENARVLVLYGDVPLIDADCLRPLIHNHGRLAVLVAELNDPSGYGRVLVDATGHVGAIVEQKDATAEQRQVKTVNTGLIAADSMSLASWLKRLRNENAQGEYYLTDIFAFAANDGAAAIAVPVDDPRTIEGANDQLQLARLERVFQSRQAERLAIQGVRFADPTRFDLRGELTVGSDVFIDVDVIIEGHVTLGDRVSIGPFTRVKNCRIENNTQVMAHCDLEDGQIGEDCRIGPFARIRPGTQLGREVHIGNFVETKKSQLADGAKANHLAYLGDAVIGAKVNIGAGTITCNYDGVNKSQTIIESGAFIGSNSSLVAPVRIGKNATVGAGSVISKDAPDEQLTVSRARQTTISGWKRPQKKK